MGLRAMVVQTHTSLPKMASPHTWVSILPGSLPRLYIWHASCRHDFTLTSPSTRHRLL